MIFHLVILVILFFEYIPDSEFLSLFNMLILIYKAKAKSFMAPLSFSRVEKKGFSFHSGLIGPP